MHIILRTVLLIVVLCGVVFAQSPQTQIVQQPAEMVLKSSFVLWLAQFFLTLFPAWFLYLLFRQAKRSGYRERSALPFAAALFTWTAAGVINVVSVCFNVMPYFEITNSLIMLDVFRVLLSTINTLFLTIGATRLDNFPTRMGGDFLRRLSNKSWGVLGFLMLATELLVHYLRGLKAIRTLDMTYGLLAAVLITAGLVATFLRYEMGKMLTAGIIITLWGLEIVLFFLKDWQGNSGEDALFLTAVLVTSKVAFMMVLVMMAAAWGRYYTSGTIEELKRGGMPQRVRPLFEVIPGGNTEHTRRNAYHAILSYWPDSPILLEAIKTEGPSSKEVIAASRNPQMIADLIEAGILNLGLSHVGEVVTNQLMSASTRAEDLDGQKVIKKGKV